jgi:hypothetical protein
VRGEFAANDVREHDVRVNRVFPAKVVVPKVILDTDHFVEVETLGRETPNGVNRQWSRCNMDTTSWKQPIDISMRGYYPSHYGNSQNNSTNRAKATYPTSVCPLIYNARYQNKKSESRLRQHDHVGIDINLRTNQPPGVLHVGKRSGPRGA